MNLDTTSPNPYERFEQQYPDLEITGGGYDIQVRYAEPGRVIILAEPKGTDGR